MDNHQNIGKMLSGVGLIKEGLVKSYEFLPRSDYYRLKQLVEEAEAILAKHQ